MAELDWKWACLFNLDQKPKMFSQKDLQTVVCVAPSVGWFSNSGVFEAKAKLSRKKHYYSQNAVCHFFHGKSFIGLIEKIMEISFPPEHLLMLFLKVSFEFLKQWDFFLFLS